MHFDDLISRADEHTLQTLVGQAALRLIGTLDERMLVPSKLRDVVLKLFGAEGLLSNAEKRALLIDLLSQREARQLAGVLGLADSGDVFASLRQLRVRRGSKKEETLFNYFGLDQPVDEAAPAEAAHKLCPAAYGLFDHQRRAAFRAQNLLVQPPHRVVIHMPTGSGKTRTAMNLISEHLRNGEQGLVVWLAYSEELCEQAASEFEDAWSHLGNRPLAVYRYWGNRDLSLSEVRDGFMVAGLAKLYAASKRSLGDIGKLSSRSSLIIIDEAHQSIADTYRLTLDSLLALRPDSMLLGLTATPGRTYADVHEDERLARYFAKQKVTLEVEGFDSPVTFLIEEGYLARPRFVHLTADTELDLTSSELKSIQEELEIPNSILQRLAEDEMRNLLILSRIEQLAKRHWRTLVFATTVPHSDLLATVLQARGIDAHSVTASTSPTERSRIIERFRSGSDRPIVLCNYGVLTAGFDAPKTSAALIARPTKSLVLYSQMVGRAIRGIKAGGNKECEIVTVVDTRLPGFGDIAEAFTNWEDVWK